MKHIKRLIIIVAILSLTGCYSNPEDVPLSNPEEILTYAQRVYGKAKISGIEKDETDGKLSSITYHLTDSQYKFDYTIECFIHQVWIDTPLGYTERKSSNFTENYENYLFNTLKSDIEQIESNYCLQISNLLEVTSLGYSSESEGVTLLGKAIEKLDTRKYLNNQQIDVYDTNGEMIGQYVIFGEYQTIETINTNKYMQPVVRKYGTKAKFLRTEEFYIYDVPGIDINEVYEPDHPDNQTATLYYFELDGKEYFTSDITLKDMTYYHNYR